MLTLGPPDPSCSMSLRTDDEQPISPSLPQLVHSEELECEDLEDEEDEDGEEEDSIPEHEFDIKTTEGKFGRMKGVAREKVSLTIGNNIFRKRRQIKNGSIIFTCNGCEAMAPKKYLSAITRITEDGTYELIEWPRLDDHSCWADGNQALHRKARNEMLSKVTQDPTRSAQLVYEEVRNSFTENMESEEKFLFLSNFPTFKEFHTILYRKRLELIPPNPKTMIDLNVDLPMFQYSRDETVVKGDQVLTDGRRVILFTTNAHLKLLSKSEEVLADGTFRTTPRPWKQNFIISAKVTSSVFVPVVFVLLPDKKRDSYDAMFSLLAEILESQGLEMSATYFMSGTILFQLNFV